MSLDTKDDREARPYHLATRPPHDRLR